MCIGVCRTQEKGRVKCGQYWPEVEEGELECDEFRVTNTAIEQNREYTITELCLHNTQVHTQPFSVMWTSYDTCDVKKSLS